MFPFLSEDIVLRRRVLRQGHVGGRQEPYSLVKTGPPLTKRGNTVLVPTTLDKPPNASHAFNSKAKPGPHHPTEICEVWPFMWRVRGGGGDIRPLHIVVTKNRILFCCCRCCGPKNYLCPKYLLFRFQVNIVQQLRR